MAKKKPGGNPKNRSSGRVTEASTVPKHVRQDLRAFKARGGTIEELHAIDRAIDQRLEELNQ